VIPVIDSGAGLLAITAVLAYLLGSIPFGVAVARAFRLGDPRGIGSGNIGATNILRTGNKPAAALTLIGDAGKGALAVLIARAAGGEEAAQLAGLAAFLGHCHPVYLGFRGGKGVATFMGVLWALTWPIGAAAGAIWLLVAAVTRYSSLSALVAAAFSPVAAVLMGAPDAGALCIALAALIFARHHENIRRLLAGTEARIGAK